MVFELGICDLMGEVVNNDIKIRRDGIFIYVMHIYNTGDAYI